MTLFDIIAVAILLASGAVGYVRGGVRELITVAAFVLAVVIAAAGLRISGPAARHAIHVGVLANAVAFLSVFVIAYALLRIVGHLVTRRLHPSETPTRADRAFGVAFGLVRGVVLLGVFYLLFSAATPPERVPRWIKNAAFYPLSGSAGHVLMALAPEGSVVASTVAPPSAEARSGRRSPGGGSGRGGYDAAARRNVDDLVEKSR